MANRYLTAEEHPPPPNEGPDLADFLARLIKLRAVPTGSRALADLAPDPLLAFDSLVESEARYRALADLAPDAILVNQDGRYVYANAEAARLVGADRPEDLIGRTPFDLHHPDYHDLVRARVRTVLEERRRTPLVECRWLRQDGATVDVEVAAGPITWQGQPAVQVVARDVGRRKRAEAALREAREAAERATIARSQFLSTMSHELRTPLTAVLGYSDLLELEVAGPVTPMQQQYLDRIKASARHLVGIIDEILTFSRMHAGKEEVRLGTVDLAGIAGDVISLLAPEAHRRGIVLLLRGVAGPAWLDTDEGKVRQIVLNLVGNALKYTDTGMVEVDLAREPERLLLYVRDTGRGIPPDRLEDIFEPFVQVDGSNTRSCGGTGLGLAISRRQARLLGGDITVASAPGRGSTFTLQLPAAVRPAAEIGA